MNAKLFCARLDVLRNDLAIASGALERAVRLASAIEAATAGETSTEIEGSTEGESAVPQGDAHE
jgi:hypothetical protein